MPCSRVMRRSAFMTPCAAMRPRQRMIFGSTRAICRARKGAQACCSSGSGSRLCGGRHLTMLAIYTRVRSRSTSSSIVSSSLPAGPTKGRPCRSSCSPGPSPISMISACSFPSPNTRLFRPRQSAQASQRAQSRLSFLQA